MESGEDFQLHAGLGEGMAHGAGGAGGAGESVGGRKFKPSTLLLEFKQVGSGSPRR